MIQGIKVLSFKNLDKEQKDSMHESATIFFNKKRHNYPKLTNYLYDLAVLVNPGEENPPSNNEALDKLRHAANKRVFISNSSLKKTWIKPTSSMHFSSAKPPM